MSGLLSVVLPAYNESEVIELSIKTLCETFENANINYELVFVDDGSKDDTWKKLSDASSDSHIKAIHFSRNFGKEAAIFAGLEMSKGDCVIVMDCDLQHPPKTAVEMYRLWEQGFEVVEGVKNTRGKETIFHTIAANTFYKMMSSSAGIDMSRASDFKLLDRKAVTALLKLPERNMFFRALSSWVGFKSTQIEYDVAERAGGSSKWSTVSLVKYALKNITSFTSFPLQLVSICGVVMILICIFFAVEAIITYSQGNAKEGFTTVILLLTFASSVLMLSLGIIGYYLSKIYEEIKGRPRYIIAETRNMIDETRNI
ncbi:MAG: glycosyltransferase family 2 protein [Lachnospiraceae bacterium]|nr:glycosyltransferase family 2 protein [Lachnospiraceae bacterium]